jgi:hypothetical protein
MDMGCIQSYGRRLAHVWSYGLRVRDCIRCGRHEA